jgi:hypothetical protein
MSVEIRPSEAEEPGADIRFSGTTEEFLADMEKHGFQDAELLIYPFGNAVRSESLRIQSEERYAALVEQLGRGNVFLTGLQTDARLTFPEFQRGEHARVLVRQSAITES